MARALNYFAYVQTIAASGLRRNFGKRSMPVASIAPSLCTNPGRKLHGAARLRVRCRGAWHESSRLWDGWIGYTGGYGGQQPLIFDIHGEPLGRSQVLRLPFWGHPPADVTLGNRRRQCFRGQRQLLWYADSTPCWSQDHSLPSALTLNDAVAYPARTPNLASDSAIKDRVVEPMRELILAQAAWFQAGNTLG